MTAIPAHVGFHHTAIFVDDIEATIRFYTEGLGLTVHYDFPSIHVAEGPMSGQELASKGALIQTSDGTYVELFPRPHDAESQSPTFPLNHIALAVPDMDAAYRRALDHGARPHAIDLETGTWDGSPLKVQFQGNPKLEAYIAFVLGPDRELIEFFKEVES